MVNLFMLMAEVADQANKADTVLERLDPPRRAAVILALVGLGLLGALLIVVVLLGGRWARQDRSPRPSRFTGTSEESSTANRTPPKPRSNELRSGETLAEPPGDGETKS
ncbi:hypothetical protein [Aeoliella mucimassa]|uniref:Uncharacterized protein n=1 Tax=Aeoliella mucimassa TaxID=2527972 RepID=A0A518ASW5_9BACT|nr:hypothetical protein [Aeoliella mucimassa]QDU57814.1 hypothetical protein Pan181_40370 [Aeoliella mucimassa]